MAGRKSRAQAVQAEDQEWQPSEVHQYDDDNRRTFLKFLPLLRFMAKRVGTGSQEGVTTEDLVSAGTIGLLQAMRKYDDKRGTRFCTFAYARIRGAMIDELRTFDWFPRSIRSKAKKLEMADQLLRLRLKRQPTDQEMAEELGMNVFDYLGRAREMANLSIVSIEAMREMGDPGPEELHREGTESCFPSLETYAEKREELAAMAQQVSALPERQRRVCQLYFYDDMTLKEIASEIGVSEPRVCQIRQQGIASLRASFKKG